MWELAGKAQLPRVTAAVIGKWMERLLPETTQILCVT